jgi:predicted permease
MTFTPILYSLSSLMIVMLLGLASRKSGLLAADHKKVLSTYIYYFALPALFCGEIATTDFRELGATLFIGSIAPVLLVLGLLALLHALKVLSKDPFVLAAVTIVFGSNAFFGVAFFDSLWEQWGFHTSVLSASILGMFGVTASLFLFEYATHKAQIGPTLLRVGKSPVIIGIALGLFFSLLRLEISFLMKGLQLIGNTAAGVAMFLLGMFMYDNFSRKIFAKAIVYSMIRIIALPLAMGLTFLFLGETSLKMKEFLFMQTGIPAAISIAVFAERYDYKTPEFSGIVVVTSLLSFISLGVLYFFAQGF